MRDQFAAHDPITGFLDRRACRQALSDWMNFPNSGSYELAVLWLNIDRFRRINESFGHNAGDKVIACLADRIRQVLGAMPAALGRMGSDEFVIICDATNLKAAEYLARSLLSAMVAAIRIDSLLIHPSISIGLALRQPRDDAFRLLERADRAMHDAKKLGGGRLVISSHDIRPRDWRRDLAREELAIEADLHTALEQGGLTMVYQPIINRSQQVIAAEGLMRCRIHDRELPPDKFIPVAEKTGLIARLGEWSLLQGARFAAHLIEAGHLVSVAINVSRAQLTSPTFRSGLNAALLCSRLPAANLDLEITESLALEASEAVQGNLHHLRSIGINISIDDFGTGYSSLSSLKDLPANKLKLDQSFIRSMPGDQRAAAVISAVSSLGKKLGMLVVAEGVETEAQFHSLLIADVDAFQGYHIARPMTEDAFMNWLAGRPRS